MIRFARHPDGVVGVDVRAALPGRGAWTCANPACVQRAVEKGGLLRAFEEAIVVDKEALCLEVDRVFSQEAQRGLSIARRMGRLWPGRTEALDAVRRTPGKVALVIAGDLAERSRQDVERDLPEGVLVCLGGTKDEMGHALGRRPTGVLALALGPQATALVSDLSRLAQFRGTTSGGRGPTSTGPDSTESKTGAAPAGTGSLAPEPTRGESAPESASAKSGIPRVAVRSRPRGHSDLDTKWRGVRSPRSRATAKWRRRSCIGISNFKSASLWRSNYFYRGGAGSKGAPCGMSHQSVQAQRIEHP